MCEHNPRNSGQSYCAYCRVTELETRLAQLADKIRAEYTPFAFTCSCKGAHDECRLALDNPALWAQRDTAHRIADMIGGKS